MCLCLCIPSKADRLEVVPLPGILGRCACEGPSGPDCEEPATGKPTSYQEANELRLRGNRPQSPMGA